MSVEERLYAALREAGMSDVPERFTIAPLHQDIPRATLDEIDTFIRVFDRVTTRPAWQQGVTADGPEIARSTRSETCFFSAWDFHIPSDGRRANCQLIECNDNGSGLMFAALLNDHYYAISTDSISNEQSLLSVEMPSDYSAFEQRVIGMIRGEAEAFFGAAPAPLPGLVLVLDDAESIESGRFRHELVLLRDLCRRSGWSSELGSPSETRWDGTRLLFRGAPVAFVVNRATDFFFEADDFSPLRAAYGAGSVYVAPNPFTYATRSDKRLLELLSSPARDAELGIGADERAVLSAHVPETHVLRAENVDELVLGRDDLFFKPTHGFASHGLLGGAQVGRTRLRRLLKKGESYVAQRRAPKLRLETKAGVNLWADLRVWAYRGERFLLSGRASLEPDRLDLSPPGGWLPTYAARALTRSAAALAAPG